MYITTALGDGTEYSNSMMQEALNRLWPYTGEMFAEDDIDESMAAANIAPHPSSLRLRWEETVGSTFRDARLQMPDSEFTHTGGKNGRRHTEHLGHMLSTMQVLQRSYPGAVW